MDAFASTSSSTIYNNTNAKGTIASVNTKNASADANESIVGGGTEPKVSVSLHIPSTGNKENATEAPAFAATGTPEGGKSAASGAKLIVLSTPVVLTAANPSSSTGKQQPQPRIPATPTSSTAATTSHSMVTVGPSAAAYYFHGPPTPVQQMVRSEQGKQKQQKLVLETMASDTNSSSSGIGRSKLRTDTNATQPISGGLHDPHAKHSDATGVLSTYSLNNQSYLSSSSDGSDNNNNNSMDDVTNAFYTNTFNMATCSISMEAPEFALLQLANNNNNNDIHNTSVLSDPTELTASHYVALAATERTPGGAPPRRLSSVSSSPAASAASKPTAPAPPSSLPLFEKVIHQRRQTLGGDSGPAAAVSVPKNTKRRETLAAMPLLPNDNTKTNDDPNMNSEGGGALSPGMLSRLVKRLKDKRLLREQEQQQQQQNSTPNVASGVDPNDLQHPNDEAAEGTIHASISTADMQALLQTSSQKHILGCGQQPSQPDHSPTLQLFHASSSSSSTVPPTSEPKLDDDDETALSMGDLMQFHSPPPQSTPETQPSPAASKTRSHRKKGRTLTKQSPASTSKDLLLSPARNTRSQTKPAMGTMDSSAATRSTFQSVEESNNVLTSPSRNTRSQTTKQAMRSEQNDAWLALSSTASKSVVKTHSSPRSTRSATKQKNSDKDEASLLDMSTTTSHLRSSSRLVVKSPGRTPTKSPNKSTVDLPSSMILQQSPAKNTRSASQRSSIASSTTNTANSGNGNDADNKHVSTERKRLTRKSLSSTSTDDISVDELDISTDLVSIGGLLDDVILRTDNEATDNADTTGTFENEAMDCSVNLPIDIASMTSSLLSSSSSLEKSPRRTPKSPNKMDPSLLIQSPAKNTRSASKRTSVASSVINLTNSKDGDDSNRKHISTEHKRFTRKSLSSISRDEAFVDELDNSTTLVSIGGLLDDVILRTNTERAENLENVTLANDTMDCSVNLQELLADVVVVSNKEQETTDVSPSEDTTASPDSIGSQPDLRNNYQDSATLNQASQRSVASWYHGNDASYAVRSDFSKASSLSTPAGLSRGDESSTAANNLPRSPPTTIRFTSTIEQDFGLSTTGREESFDITAPVPVASLRKTPVITHGQHSPHRFDHASNAKDSLYSRALTPTRLQASPMRMVNPIGARISAGALQKSMTPTRLQPSPLWSLSSKRKSAEDVPVNLFQDEQQQHFTSATKRSRKFEELLNHKSIILENSEQQMDTADITSHSNLQSVLRIPGGFKRRTETRRVAFGSPTTAEYNISSPSMRLTPLPKRTPFVESNDINIAQQNAGSTPFAQKRMLGRDTAKLDIKSKLDLRETDGDSDMSMDSMGSLPTDNERTVTLEHHMFELLGGDAISMHLLSNHFKSEAERIEQNGAENTIELESDINHLLTNTKSYNVEHSSELQQAPFSFENENTMELESDMIALFDAIGPNSNDGKTPVSTHRFSIAPASNLSLSVDGSFTVDAEGFGPTQEVEEAVSSPPTEKILPKESHEKIDLKIHEIISRSDIEVIGIKDGSDLLSGVASVLSEHCMSDTINALIREVHQTIVNATSTLPKTDLNACIPFKDENILQCRALQRSVRSQGNEVITQIREMTATLQESDIFEWQMWLLSATEQLERNLDEEKNHATVEMRRLDDFFTDVSNALLTWNQTVYRKARRKSIIDRKVRLVGCLKLTSHIKMG